MGVRCRCICCLRKKKFPGRKVGQSFCWRKVALYAFGRNVTSFCLCSIVFGSELLCCFRIWGRHRVSWPRCCVRCMEHRTRYRTEDLLHIEIQMSNYYSDIPQLSTLNKSLLFRAESIREVEIVHSNAIPLIYLASNCNRSDTASRSHLTRRWLITPICPLVWATQRSPTITPDQSWRYYPWPNGSDTISASWSSPQIPRYFHPKAHYLGRLLRTWMFFGFPLKWD